ncbi:adenylate/guanylate cyclase domain-containing protein, partial [bacterium]|nr:adenylate/guanylate cyclase domain-containing protein [bacterium]
KDIAIIGIDQQTGFWADRPYFAFNPLFGEFIQAMITASASAVLLDVIFESSPDNEIRRLFSDLLRKSGISVPPQLLNRVGFDFPLRNALLDAKKSNLKVVLGFGQEAGNPTNPLNKQMIGILVPSEQKGFLNVRPDDDQVIRSTALIAKSNDSGKVVPSADLALASQICRSSFFVSPVGDLVFNQAPIRNLSQGRIGYIDYAGPMNTYPMESFKNVLIDSRDHPERLKRFSGKTLLVGAWGIEDNKPVPVSDYMPGIEIHANIVENIIKQKFLAIPGFFVTVCIMSIFCLIQFFAFNFGSKFGAYSTFFLFSFWGIACFWAFKNSLVLPFSRPLIFTLLSGLSEGFWMFRSIEDERKKTRELFRRYVNDVVIESILSDPSEQITKGVRRKICVMFTDIRGFTSFSENRDPREVVSALNRYFEILTNTIFKHNGVVDKFLGDGIMSFFNAPMENPNYCADAVDFMFGPESLYMSGKHW